MQCSAVRRKPVRPTTHPPFLVGSVCLARVQARSIYMLGAASLPCGMLNGTSVVTGWYQWYMRRRRRRKIQGGHGGLQVGGLVLGYRLWLMLCGCQNEIIPSFPKRWETDKLRDQFRKCIVWSCSCSPATDGWRRLNSGARPYRPPRPEATEEK